MRKLFGRLLHAYRSYKFVMWILSLSGLLAPLVSWGVYALRLLRLRRGLVADDNPELAVDYEPVGLGDWLTGFSDGSPVRVVWRVLGVLGVLLLVLVVVCRVGVAVADRTRLSGGHDVAGGDTGGSDKPDAPVDTGDEDGGDRLDDYGAEL